MPYIPRDDRDDVRPDMMEDAENAGQLNYQISTLCSLYLNQHGMRYQTMNDIIGALQGALMEFNRVVVGPYEDTKLEQNGGVYFNQFGEQGGTY